MKSIYPGTGTTLCPHCGTRFKIAESQLEADHSLVRCGHCLHAFDTRPNFAPEEIDPQLELPILHEAESEQPLAELSAPGSYKAPVLFPLTLADQTVFMPDIDRSTPPESPSRLWTVAAVLLLLLLLGQATFLFRVELAARLPEMKPVLVRYCELLKCSVPLPRKVSLMSIESSELKDDPAHRNQIDLIVQLRNRATYVQEYPNLELTLTDSQDKALARRIFRPENYLSTPEQLTAGLPANQELSIKLHLDTADLKPVGYRLVLYYASGQPR